MKLLESFSIRTQPETKEFLQIFLAFLPLPLPPLPHLRSEQVPPYYLDFSFGRRNWQSTACDLTLRLNLRIRAISLVTSSRIRDGSTKFSKTTFENTRISGYGFTVDGRLGRKGRNQFTDFGLRKIGDGDRMRGRNVANSPRSGRAFGL